MNQFQNSQSWVVKITFMTYDVVLPTWFQYQRPLTCVPFSCLWAGTWSEECRGNPTLYPGHPGHPCWLWGLVHGFSSSYPLVMTNIANWKDPPFFMGKSTISLAIFNSYVKLPEGKPTKVFPHPLSDPKSGWKIAELPCLEGLASWAMSPSWKTHATCDGKKGVILTMTYHDPWLYGDSSKHRHLPKNRSENCWECWGFWIFMDGLHHFI